MEQSHRISSILIATVVVVGATLTPGHAEDRASEPKWQKSVASLRASLVVTDEVEKYSNGWSRPLKSVPMREVDQLATGISFYALVAFAGCAPNDAGVCDLTSETRVRFPDGRVVDLGPLSVWVGYPPPPPGYFELGTCLPELFFEPGDPVGDFTITTRIYDWNAGTQLEVSRVIRHTGAYD